MKNVEKWIMVVLIIISVGAIGTAVYFGVNKIQNNEDNEIPSVNSQNGNDENEDKETGSEVVDEEDLIIDNDSIDGEFESQKDSLTTDNNNNKDESNNNKKPIKDKNNSSENIYVDTVIPTPCKVSFEYKIITFSDGKTFGSADWIVGEPYPEPKSPEKEGYVFKGWYLDGKKYDFSKPVMGDITLVAEWEELFYTVTFDTKGGTKIEPQKVKVDGGIVRKPENPTKEGYVFLWWNEKENPNLGAGHVNFGYGISGDSELEAMWAKEKKLKVKQELVGCTLFQEGGTCDWNLHIDLNISPKDEVIAVEVDKNGIIKTKESGLPKIFGDIHHDAKAEVVLKWNEDKYFMILIKSEDENNVISAPLRINWEDIDFE